MQHCLKLADQVKVMILSYLKESLLHDKSNCCLWKLGSSTGSQEKLSKDPCTEDYGVTQWFIYVEGYSWIPSLSAPSCKKPNHVLSKTKYKRPTWFHTPGWQHTWISGVNMLPGGWEGKTEKGRERASFPGIVLTWVWNWPGTFSKDQLIL